MYRILLLLGVLVIQAACATTQIKPSAATPAPSDRLLAFQNKTDATTSVLVVTRDVGFLGGGCFYSFSINGTLAARLDVGETSQFFVEPGEILLRVGRDPLGRGLCGAGQQYWTQRESMIKPGETKYFRLIIQADGQADIQRADLSID